MTKQFTVTYINTSENEERSTHTAEKIYVDENGNLMLLNAIGETVAAFSRYIWRHVD